LVADDVAYNSIFSCSFD